MEIVNYKGRLWKIGDTDSWFDGETYYAWWELIPYGWEGDVEFITPTEWIRNEVVHVRYENGEV